MNVRPCALASAWWLLNACASGPPPVHIESITPSSTAEGTSRHVLVAGAFPAKYHVSFTDPNGDRVDKVFVARLGDIELDDVQFEDTDVLNAVVPASLPIGQYDLTVVTPGGERGTLADAFAVLSTSACQAEPSCCPGTTEICDGVVDENCDGEVDEEGAMGCVTHYRDEDGDGHGVEDDSRCLCAPSGVYRAVVAGDCDDAPSGCGAECHPGRAETCDGFDNDCDAATPEPDHAYLWLSTAGDSPSPSGAPGLDAWLVCDVLRFDDPGLSLTGSPASGTFYADVRIRSDSASACADITALDRVDADIVVGQSNPFPLLEGDLLLSPDGNVTFASTNTLSARDEDVVVFRPTSPSDYSAGTFHLLLDSPLANSIEAISLVHTETRVGDYDVPAGTLLLAQGGNIQGNRVYLYRPDSTGGSTSGTSNLLIDGDDIDMAVHVRALHVVETDTSLGGVQLRTGQILLSVASTSDIGSPGLTVQPQDVWVLDVVATTLQTGTAEATPTILLPGADLGLEASGERVAAVAVRAETCN